MMNKTLISHASALLLAALIAGPSAAATLSLNPSNAQPSVGGGFSVELLISDLGADEALAVFDLTLNFDSTLFSFGSYTLGGQLGSLASFEAMDLSAGVQGPGSVHLGELSLLADLPDQPKAFSLATLNFTAKAAGTGAFSLAQVTLGDSWGTALPANLSGATVTAVPEPASYALLLAGMGLLAARRRKSTGA